ncbi:mitochondrial basic amino acids transporter-like [Atheta coriaria]|uniref:mitochondrial basic amino acids transporter-like n=1 Tax=Dalotia coriaria TaxID=877792 RepID=UPI0031F34D8E
MALEFFAGSLGGCAGVLIGHPFDTIKVQIQNSTSKYSNARDCIRKLYKHEGIHVFFRGMTSPLAAVAGINAIVFSIYGQTQKCFDDPNAYKTHFLSGACAGFFQSVIASPMELAKVRVQIHNTVGPLECIRHIYHSEGVKGVFRGLTMTVLRDVPSFALYFLTYEYLAREQDGRHAGTSQLLMAGGLAGVVSWTLTYPLDMIKTRMQCDGINGVSRYSNAWDCYKKSIAQNGHRVLFRGLTPTLVRAFPVNAVVFTVVTWTLRVLENGFKFDFIVMPQLAVA